VVRVAETWVKRNELAREILLSVVVPQLLLILTAGIVVWLGVVRGLAPLKRLQRALSARSHRDRSPVVVDHVPGEVSPLVHSINELLARLDGALTLQSRFIADAAHQLKTPIAALKTQLEVTQRETDPERMRHSLRESYAGLERLSRLVSQLLSLARNEPEAAGEIPLAPLDLNALALEVATGWVPEALKKRIDLGFEGSPGPAMMRGDPVRLRELLDNLLDNAVRYSREGGRVTVRVSGQPAPAVEVNDDGPGIPAEERERVFRRFHRLLGSSVEGSGLGLAIAQEIARLHGGEIGLRDDIDGIGNTFSVSFPAL
jgi:two-component system sensor histidine kinase TctE